MRRGEVRTLRLRKGAGHKQHGPRFGVVVQADALLPRSTVLVAPTSRSAKPATFRPEIAVDGTPTRVLVEQIGAVDASRLGEPITQLTATEQWAIDTALLTVLDLT